MHWPAPSPSLGLITPASSAAIAVIGLKVEPVGYSPSSARLVSRPGSSPWRPASASYSASVSGLANLFGSKLGEEPIASTSPLSGSSATNAPAIAGLPPALRVFFAFQQRLFARPLQAQVERRLQHVPRARRDRRELAGDGLTFGVDRDPLLARHAAQVVVVVVLEARLPDDRARLHAAERGRLQLVFVDLIRRSRGSARPFRRRGIRESRPVPARPPGIRRLARRSPSAGRAPRRS